MIPKPNYVRVLTHFSGLGVWSPLGKAGMPAPACFRWSMGACVLGPGLCVGPPRVPVVPVSSHLCISGLMLVA